MSDLLPTDVPPEQQAANRRLGLRLGLFAVVLVIGFIILFTLHGLPKDPDVWRAMNASGSGSSTTASGTTP